MTNEIILNELGQILRQRGEVTKEQREYAKVEEQVMKDMYPLTKPSEEIRRTHYRTLESYIGKQAARMILKDRRIYLSLNQIL